MKLTRAMVFMVALAMTVAVSACGGDSADTTTTAAAATTTTAAATTTAAPGATTTAAPATTTTTMGPQEILRVVVQSGAPGPNITDLPIYVGQEAGFFEDEGLRVTFQYGEGGSLAAQLASAGRVDISTNTFEPAIPGYQEGLRGKVFFEVNRHVTYYISALASSPYEQLSDLVGKKIGAASLGSTAIPVAKVMFVNAGLDPDSVEFVPVGVGASAAAALEGGDVDALALWNGAFAGVSGLGIELREFRDPNLLEFGNGGTWASDELVQSSPDLIGRYARALAKSMVLIRDYPEVAARMYFAVSPEAETSLGFDETVRQIKYVGEDFTQDRPLGEMNLDKAQEFIDLYASLLGVEDPPTAEDIMTNDFIAQANDFEDQVVADAAQSYGQ